MRVNEFYRNIGICSANKFKSPTFDTLSAAKRLGLLYTVMHMKNETTPLYGKIIGRSKRMCGLKHGDWWTHTDRTFLP